MTMKVLRAIRGVAIAGGMSFVAATAALAVWFGWKWGAHYAGVWWRGVRERLEAGDTTINQASWWMRDRWETLGRVWDGPKINSDSAPQVLAVIGGASVLFLLLRMPGAVVAGWLGRRAIRRDGILCEPALAKSLGRRVLVDGALRWVVPAGIAVGAAMALVNHLSNFGDYLMSRESRMVAMLCTPLAFLVVDVPCSLRWSRHLIAKNIRGRQRMCRWCGFDVTSLGKGMCSECGKRVDAKARDVGVRVVVRPREAKVAGMVVVFALVVAGGIGWAVANVKGVGVWDEGRRFIDSLMLKRTEDSLRVMTHLGRVIELHDGSSRLLMCVTLAPMSPQRGLARQVRMLLVRTISIEGDRSIRTESIEHTYGRASPTSYAKSFVWSSDRPVMIWVPRSVEVAKFPSPDLSDQDMAWLRGGD